MAQAIQDKNVLITGASSGIGYELSKIFAQEGKDLILVARSMDKLNDIAGELHTRYKTSVKIITADLAQPNSADVVYNHLKQNSIDVDILVNNAGFGMLGKFTETEFASEKKMMQLNIVSLVTLTKHIIKDMMEKKRGRIMNVASTAAFQPGPLMSVYYATKAFVYSFSEAIAAELEGSGITVTTFCPGPTRTNFAMEAGTEKAFIFNRINTLSAAAVAATGYKGLMSGKRLVIPGIMNKFYVQLERILPKRLVMKTVMLLHK